MKKLTMISMAALLLLAVSCKKDKEQQIDGSGIGFRATVESHAGDSKTHLDGVAVKWDSNDEIMVQSSTCTAGKRFVLVYEEGDEAGFNPAETLPEGFYSPNYTAYYPAGMMQTGTFTLPAIQTYKANSFGNGANPMIAVCDDNKKLAFKNICGLLKLQLYSEAPCQVRSISITSNAGEQLCGTGTVTLTDGIPALGTLTGGGSTLTLDMGTGGEFMSIEADSPSVYYFVVPAGTLGTSFTVKVTDMDGKYWIKAAPADGINTIARSKIKPMPTQKVGCTIPEGALPGLFSVGSGRKVYFSQGNLQYCATGSTSTAESGANVGGTWRFADHQFDYIGKGNENAAQTYGGWIDLFCWGTSGYNHGATSYQPWSKSAANENYYAYGNPNKNLYDSDGKADWGANAISNGGNQPGKWRTLTKDEWVYLIDTRKDGSDKLLYGEGKVDGTQGLIILPDGWSCPSGLTDVSRGASSWSNVYSYSQWAQMEAAGAVFLPAAGRRDGASVSEVGSESIYWSSSSYILYNSPIAYGLQFISEIVAPANYHGRFGGFSVRLVSNVPAER